MSTTMLLPRGLIQMVLLVLVCTRSAALSISLQQEENLSKQERKIAYQHDLEQLREDIHRARQDCGGLLQRGSEFHEQGFRGASDKEALAHIVVELSRLLRSVEERSCVSLATRNRLHTVMIRVSDLAYGEDCAAELKVASAKCAYERNRWDTARDEWNQTMPILVQQKQQALDGYVNGHAVLVNATGALNLSTLVLSLDQMKLQGLVDDLKTLDERCNSPLPPADCPEQKATLIQAIDTLNDTVRKDQDEVARNQQLVRSAQAGADRAESIYRETAFTYNRTSAKLDEQVRVTHDSYQAAMESFQAILQRCELGRNKLYTPLK